EAVAHQVSVVANRHRSERVPRLVARTSVHGEGRYIEPERVTPRAVVAVIAHDDERVVARNGLVDSLDERVRIREVLAIVALFYASLVGDVIRERQMKNLERVLAGVEDCERAPEGPSLLGYLVGDVPPVQLPIEAVGPELIECVVRECHRTATRSREVV